MMQYSSFIKILAGLSLVFLSGCMNGPGFLQQDNAAQIKNQTSTKSVPVEQNSDGTLSAMLSSSSGETQTVQVPEGSGVAGAEITFPPGTLSVDTTLTVEEGGSLATSDVATELGLEGGGGSVSGASTALVISSSENIDATQPFTVSLLLDPAAGLALQDNRRLVVFYKVRKVESGSGIFVGIIQDNDLSLVDGKVAFKTRFFGSYQAIYVTVDTAGVVEKPTSTPIETKREPLSDTTDNVADDSTGGDDAVYEIEKLDVVGVTPTSISLRWQHSRNPAGYMVAYGEESLNQAGSTGTSTIVIAEECKGGQQLNVAPTGQVTETVINNLRPRVFYAIRVCAYSSTGRMSKGILIRQQTFDLAPGNASGLSANVKSSRTVEFAWTQPTTVIAGYLLAWNVGTTGGPVVSPPTDCKVAQYFLDRSEPNVEINQFPADTSVGLRVCSKNTTGQLSSGVAINARTQNFSFSCTTGDLDHVCVIDGSTTVYPTANTFVAGLGDLVIEPNGRVMANNGQPLIIDMKGKVETQNFSVMFGSIEANGTGYPGGTNGSGVGKDNLAGGTGAGKVFGGYGGGGGHGGEGGVKPGVSPSLIARPFGDYSFPIYYGGGGAGSSGGTGGSGGGHITIRAGYLLNNGKILALGNGGSGGDDGGGAGGSILIQAARIHSDVGAFGEVVASGGGGSGDNGGGGSGGRIAVYFSAPETDLTNMTFSVDGGNATYSKQMGASGTIYIYDGASNIHSIKVATSTGASDTVARTPLNLASSASVKKIQDLKIGGMAKVLFEPVIPADVELVNLTIGSGAALDYSGRGFKGGYYDGMANIPAQAPTNFLTSAGAPAPEPNLGGGGGGSAGAGGTGSGGIGGSGGTAYTGQSLTAPSLAGSGGGQGADNGAPGGNGGGAVKLVLTGTLSIDGKIAANGGDGLESSAVCGGGGGGGSIWIKAAGMTTTMMSPSVRFEANGGSGSGVSCTGGSGGGGGGGAIYLDAPSIPAEVQCSVTGGSGNSGGVSGVAKVYDAGGPVNCSSGV